MTLRQIVNLWEFTFVWYLTLKTPFPPLSCISINLFSRRGKRQELRKVLRSASSYDEWKEAALELDGFMQKDTWKNNPQSSLYDANLIQNVSLRLREHRTADSIEDLEDVLLKSALKQNIGGVENRLLYSFTYHGTKEVCFVVA
jgi:hypothetical protein